MEIAPVLLDVREGGGFEDFSCTQQHQYLFVMSVTYRPFIVDLLFFYKGSAECDLSKVAELPTTFAEDEVLEFRTSIPVHPATNLSTTRDITQNKSSI